MRTKLYSVTSEPEKSLVNILKKHSGRDNTGSVAVRHQGGRQKRYYRHVDFQRNIRNIEGIVKQIEYDPNRNAHIALVEYANGVKSYILHPTNLQIGQKVVAGEQVDIRPGNALPLSNMPLGIEVHNIELYPGQGGKIVRGAGTTAQVVAKVEGYVHLRLPSGEVRKFLKDCWATVGVVGNSEHKEEIIGKAGRKRLMGIRPTVRGTAQNPHSHPHGGGEGRSGEGMHPKTPWGKPARGKRTRKPSKWSNKLIVKRRN